VEGEEAGADYWVDEGKGDEGDKEGIDETWVQLGMGEERQLSLENLFAARVAFGAVPCVRAVRNADFFSLFRPPDGGVTMMLAMEQKAEAPFPNEFHAGRRIFQERYSRTAEPHYL
jgi:hypothetical protein